MLVGPHHPSLYAFFRALQNEQGNVDTMLRQVSLGQKVEENRPPRQQIKENRIANLVARYADFVASNEELRYLKAIGYNIRL